MSELNLIGPPEALDGELEIEDVSFLPGGDTSAGKRAVYEPSIPQRCYQFLCTKGKAVFIVTALVVCAIVVAALATFGRARDNACAYSSTPPYTTVTVAPDAHITATNGEDFPWKSIRLPQTVLPTAYVLQIQPNLTTFLFNGTASITLEVVESTDFIVFHSQNLVISTHTLLSSNGEAVNIVKMLENTDHEQVYMRLKENLQPGTEYTLSMAFNGNISRGIVGLYRSSYKDEHGQTRWLATTHFEPTDARSAFPCFDEPQMKANMSVSLVRDQQHRSLSNTALLSTRQFGTDLLIDQFETSVKMSTYLVVMIVCDFANISALTNTNQVKVSVYAPPTMKEQLGYALNVSTYVLDFYESQYFKIRYPLSKSDHIAIPDFPAGAMENWGLITYRPVYLLYKEGTSSFGDKYNVATVVAHELAHQWFGNLVTMEWWNDLWLNEGFANFMEYKSVDHMEPEWKMFDHFVYSSVSKALHLDGLKSSHPISVTVHDPAQINEIFDFISYKKGGSVIRMLESFVGEETFKKGLHHYLTVHKYGNAKTQDLWDAMSAVWDNAGGVDVGKVMNTWTQQMGYPIVTVSREGQTFSASQKRFLFNPASTVSEEFTSQYDYKWYIPLTYITSDNSNPTLKWMEMKDVDVIIDGNPKWVKFNPGMKAFYRVSYDEQSWWAFSDLLAADHTVLSSADRTNLLSDAFSLAMSGHVSISVALNLSRYMVDETDFAPLAVGVDSLGYVGKMLEDTDVYIQFKQYVLSLLSKQLETISITTGTDLNKVFLNSRLLGIAVLYGHNSSVAKLREVFASWKSGKQIPLDYRSLVFTAGVQYGDHDDWQFVWDKYINEPVASEKLKLMYALFATRDIQTLSRLLYSVIEGQYFRLGNVGQAISAASSNPIGRILTWRFIRQNWDELVSKFSRISGDLYRVIKSSTRDLNTQYDYDEVKAYFDNKLKGTSVRSVSQALEAIELNISWMKKNSAEAIEWTRRNAS